MYICTYGLKHPQKKGLKNEIFTSYVELFVFSGVDNIQVTFPFTIKYCESILDLRLIAGEYFVPVWLGSEFLEYLKYGKTAEAGRSSGPALGIIGIP